MSRREPNEAQRRAILHKEGPLFIAAGAGSGKTYVLAERFASCALQEGSASLDGALAITFTEKAAGELVERVRRALIERGELDAARQADSAWVSTIHGFCRRLLKRHALEMGLDPGFGVAAEEESEAMRRQAFEEVSSVFLRSDPNAEGLLDRHGLQPVANGVLAITEKLRGMGKQPSALLLPPGGQALDDGRALVRLMEAYSERYAELKRERALLDFEDLQTMAAELLRSRPELARAYRERFVTVMVDEFQDTNQLQMEAIGPISTGALCTVGDEAQSIYGFRNADLGIFREHRRQADEAGAASVQLTENYRSHPEVLLFVNELFSRPHLFGDRFLELRPSRTAPFKTPFPDDAPRVELLLCDKSAAGKGWRQSEADALAERLAGLVRDGVEPGDIVVLLRATGDAATYAAALRARGLRVLMASGEGFFERPEVVEARGLLRVAANPLDDEAMVLVLAGRAGGLNEDSLLLLRAAAGRGPLWETLADPLAAGLAREEAQRAAKVFEAVRGVSGLGPRQALERLCAALGFDESVLGGPDGERAYANLLKLIRLAGEHERSGSGGTREFLARLELRESLGRPETCANVVAEGVSAVRIMTIHSAKGLEFPVVAVADMGRGAGGDRGTEFLVARMPEGPRLAMKMPPEAPGKPRAKGPDWEPLEAVARAADLEEGKRLLYVACTRAEELLLLAGSADLGKPPGTATSIDWVRTALPEGHGGEVALGEARVKVSIVGERAVSQGEPEAQSRPPAVDSVEKTPAAPEEAAPATVSYTALRAFELCPRRYELEHRLGLRAFRAPGAPSAADLGNALHAVLQASVPPSPPDASRVAAESARFGLDAEMKGRLERAAARYLGSPLAARVRDADRASLEQPFTVPLGRSLLVGKMDVLARSGTSALVVDYKTGSGDEASYRLQAECYALASIASGAKDVEVVFAEVERGTERAFRFDEADRAGIEERLSAAIDGMAGRNMPQREGFDAKSCGTCPALPGMCSVRRKAARSAGGAGRKRPEGQPPARS